MSLLQHARGGVLLPPAAGRTAPLLGAPLLPSCRAASGGAAARTAVVAAAKKQQAKKRKSGGKGFSERAQLEDLESWVEEVVIPSAPPVTDKPQAQMEESPDQLYPVFLPPKGSEERANAKWRWADNDGPVQPPEPEPDTLVWNPRTGFAPRPVAEQDPAAAGGAAAPAPASTAAAQRDATASASVSGQRPLMDVRPDIPADALPFVGRNQIVVNALGTGFWMAVLSLFMRNYAATGAARALGTDPATLKALLAWPEGLGPAENWLVVIGVVVAVTAARLQLMASSPDYAAAVNRSNRQVLGPLGWLDIALVSLASGVPEELLFRGAIIPATFPDWRGVAISAAVFGALHNSGGRNATFAAWAAGVGAVYGGAYLYTGNVWVPAAAHALANFASAAVWKANNSGGGAGGEQRNG